MSTSTSSTIPRRRWSPAEKLEILQAHAQRQESQAQFCRTHAVSAQTLYYWLRQRRAGRSDFIEIKPLTAAARATAILSPKVTASPVVAPVVVELAGGLSIRVPAGCELRWVVDFIGALRCGA